MLIQNATNNSFFPAAEQTLPNDMDFNRELAELKRELSGNSLSDKNRTAVQTLILQAEKAMENGNSNTAQRFIDQAFQTLDNPDNKGIPTENTKPATFENVQKVDVDERKYQDESNDPSVSFKYPRKINEYQAWIAVRSHESEHVRDAVFKAQNKGVLARVQVRFHTGFDKKGELYLKGGTTKVNSSKKGKYHINNGTTNSNIDILS